MNFEKWICERLEETGKTFTQLSQETGIMRSTLSAYSLGERVPNIERANAIANTFGYEIVIRKKK